MREIVITPTWAACMEILLAVLEDGTDEGKRSARAELRDLANKVDRLNDRKPYGYALQAFGDMPSKFTQDEQEAASWAKSGGAVVDLYNE